MYLIHLIILQKQKYLIYIEVKENLTERSKINLNNKLNKKYFYSK